MHQNRVRWVWLGAMALSLGAIVAGQTAKVTAEATKAAGIEEIMKKSFNKKVGVCPKIGPAAKDGKWEDAVKLSKELAEYGSALPSNPCPMGDAKSWEKLSKKFATDTKAVAEACANKDLAAVEAALKTLTSSCKACHDAHR